MIDRKKIQTLLDSARGSLIGALVLVVLLGSLHTVATTAVNPNKADFNAAIPSGDNYFCNCPVPMTTSGHEGMTSDGRPLDGSSTHWILPLIVKTDNSGRRLSLDCLARLDQRADISHNRDRASLCTSTFRVSSALGRQFTLVGAKPSGTS